jgi:hypothetical protein
LIGVVALHPTTQQHIRLTAANTGHTRTDITALAAAAAAIRRVRLARLGLPTVEERPCNPDLGRDRPVARTAEEVLEEVIRLHLEVAEAHLAGEVWVEEGADFLLLLSVSVPVHIAPVAFLPDDATRNLYVTPSVAGTVSIQCEPVPSPPKRLQPLPLASMGVVQLTLWAESASQQLKMNTCFSAPPGPPRMT